MLQKYWRKSILRWKCKRSKLVEHNMYIVYQLIIDVAVMFERVFSFKQWVMSHTRFVVTVFICKSKSKYLFKFSPHILFWRDFRTYVIGTTALNMFAAGDLVNKKDFYSFCELKCGLYCFKHAGDVFNKILHQNIPSNFLFAFPVHIKQIS